MAYQVYDGNPDGFSLGSAATSKVSFYGATPVIRTTATALTAIATCTFSAAFTGMWAFASSTVAKTLPARINQLVVDMGKLKTMGLFS
jgi:hypothetical protein